MRAHCLGALQGVIYPSFLRPFANRQYCLDLRIKQVLSKGLLRMGILVAKAESPKQPTGGIGS